MMRRGGAESSPLGSSILFGAATLAADGGGIARVARLTLRCLREAGLNVSAGSYLDQAIQEGALFAATPCGGSKLKFVSWAIPKLARGEAAIYDSIGPARSHTLLVKQVRPFAVWAHGVEVWEPMLARTRATLDAARVVFFNSQRTLDRHVELHGGRNNAAVCWLATEEDEPPAVPAHFDGPPTAIILGRIDDREWGKGHQELIAAWPIVRRRVPDARLVIAGGGRGLAQVRGLATASPASKAITVLGHIDQARVGALYREAHVLAMPSRQEGFGLVYVEAMRHGLPCIASRQDSGQEITVHGQTGLNVDLSGQGELAGALIALLADRNRARMYGAAGAARWRMAFCYSAFATRFTTHLRTALALRMGPNRNAA